MRVLVTGHDGYIGSVAVPMLVAAGHDVVGLDTGFFAHGTLGPHPEEAKALRMDVRDVGPEHCDGMDAVVHLAALCHDRSGDLDQRLTRAVNHAATLRLARSARRAWVARFLFAGRPDGNHLIRDIARTVVEGVYGSRVRFAAGAPVDSHDYRVSCRRIAIEIPGFRPRWTLRAGIGQLAEAYRRHRLQIDDLAGPRHQRVPGLRALRQAGRIDRDLRWVTR
jgi:nucleoside-diphosphate-sugar epimerase